MSSASRRALITAWSVSLSLLTTRSWSPWIRTWTFGLTFWTRLRRSRAMSSVIPAFRLTSIWPRPLPTVFGSPALKSFGDSDRRAAFSRRTCSAARARSSLPESIRIVASFLSYDVCVSLKSKRVATSRRAWSSALVSSAPSYSETMSNEYSATGRRENGVDARDDRDDGQRDRRQGTERQRQADPAGRAVGGLGHALVVGIGSVVQVVDARLTRSGGQFIQHRLAAGRDRPRLQVRHGRLQVVAGLAELRDDRVERL